MNTTPEYLEITKTDFEGLYQIDPREAEDRMVMLICDPALASKRFVELVQAKLMSELDSDDDGSNNTAKYQRVIDALREWGPLESLRKGLVQFSELIELIANPYTLRLAHRAMVDDEAEAADDPQKHPSTVENNFNLPVEIQTAYSLGADSGTEDQVFPSSSPKMPALVDCFDEWAELPFTDFVSRCKTFGTTSAEFDLDLALSGSSADSDVESPISSDVVALERGRISILAPFSLIPHGLCRLTLIEVGSSSRVMRTISILPRLESTKDQYWFWERSVHDLFGRNMTGTKIRTALETSVQSDFHCSEVQDFVTGLPEGEQKTRAMAYLKSRKDN